METREFYLPSHWASYFVNGDATGLEDDEQALADEWHTNEFGEASVSCCDVSEDTNFMKNHDARQFALAGDCATFTFIIHLL